MNKKKKKLTLIYGLLTALFVVLAVAGAVYFVSTGGVATKLWFIAPAAAALVCSSLMVRTRNG